MERLLRAPRGRTALVLALLCVIAIPDPRVRADGASKRTVSAPGRTWDGWQTQDWQQGGQDGDQHSRIDLPFAGAQYKPNGSPVGYPGWSVYSSGGEPFVGEAATAPCAGTANVGPQGVVVALTEEGIVALASAAAWTSYPGAETYMKEPNGLYDFVGTPVVIGSNVTQTSGRTTIGSFNVYALANKRSPSGYGYPNPQLLMQPFVTTHSVAVKSESLTVTPNYRAKTMWIQPGQYFPYGPTLAEGTLYFASHGYYLSTPGTIYAADPVNMTSKWTAPLQVGQGSTVALPRGQEPPDAQEKYHATTPVSVRGNLAVVGCEEEGGTKFALFGYDTLSGAQRWIVMVDARIQAAPAILGDIIVFGTANGRAFGVNVSNGTIRWQLSWAARLRYRTNPYNASEEYADVVLHGPAITAGGAHAWFGGSDGALHRFDTASGAMISTPGLAYHASRRGWSGGTYRETDRNGRLILRPITINSPPVVFGDKSLVVKLSTLNYGTSQNGSFLLGFYLPELGVLSNSFFGIPMGEYLAELGLFIGGGIAAIGCPLNAFPGSPFWSNDPIRQIGYFDDPGFGYFLDQYLNTGDTGGVSAGSGCLFATDAAGHLAMFPAYQWYAAITGLGIVGPFPPPAPGPTPPLGPPPLGPVTVYPNPFNPAKAVGGVAKFKNLPVNAWVELYTLAYERVRKLAQTNNRAEWDGTNEAGQPAATGVYLYKIFLPGNVPPITGRLALIRK